MTVGSLICGRKDIRLVISGHPKHNYTHCTLSYLKALNEAHPLVLFMSLIQDSKETIYHEIFVSSLSACLYLSGACKLKSDHQHSEKV